MKKTRKILAMAACAILLVCISVGATVAYLTSTDTVTNTFTVGQVKITLDEAKVNADGKPVNKDGTGVTDLSAAERVDANSYKLMPGHVYTKDPTVTVKAGSEESYVRMLVTVTFGKALTDEQLSMNLDDIFTGYSKKWKRNSLEVSDDKKTITYEYRYETTVSADKADNKLDALFTGIKIPEDWDNTKLAAIGGFEIKIVAQAVQADGFNGDADAAFGAGLPTPTPAPENP